MMPTVRTMRASQPKALRVKPVDGRGAGVGGMGTLGFTRLGVEKRCKKNEKRRVRLESCNYRRASHSPGGLFLLST
jgi:hypothetical protein